eukprot:CAMPEP_0196814782 /NCGR_PEP_ID=MMETSP1362-20130617/45732_1 /TAXON_ID=163516 /ORGANISM="Leptocylindrus danicus, Strain CCMP1856" /LENGTH=492 /DNA_ID=CAMNT_0042191519 /DNA_START=272 /DNA_END=1750 /DNA_ORIENTATION=+
MAGLYATRGEHNEQRGADIKILGRPAGRGKPIGRIAQRLEKKGDKIKSVNSYNVPHGSKSFKSIESPPKRRPRGYWSDKSNVVNELREFWGNLNVPIQGWKLPPIPNEALLNHFKRNDLRWAIASHGGRDALSYRLGGAPIIPGRWADAVLVEQVKKILDPNNPASIGLSPFYPPVAPHMKREWARSVQRRKELFNNSTRTQKDYVGNARTKIAFSGLGDVPGVRSVPDDWMDYDGTVPSCNDERETEPEFSKRYSNGRRWAHRGVRKQWGFWSDERLQDELYSFVSRYMEFSGRPSIFMPRLNDFSAHGRDDLRAAIVRSGGPEVLCERAGMISYREWEYFESLYSLYSGLKAYIDIYHEGNTEVFPPLKEIKSKGQRRLYNLIQKHGGRKIVAGRAGMKLSKATPTNRQTPAMQWGPFSLDFSLLLMNFIRSQMLKQIPPLAMTPTIKMPTEEVLMRSGEQGRYLARKIEEFGGYENTARRLGLDFFCDD